MTFSYSQLNVVPVARTNGKKAVELLDEAAEGFSRVRSSSRINAIMIERHTGEIDFETVQAAIEAADAVTDNEKEDPHETPDEDGLCKSVGD